MDASLVIILVVFMILIIVVGLMFADIIPNPFAEATEPTTAPPSVKLPTAQVPTAQVPTAQVPTTAASGPQIVPDKIRQKAPKQPKGPGTDTVVVSNDDPPNSDFVDSSGTRGVILTDLTIERYHDNGTDLVWSTLRFNAPSIGIPYGYCGVRTSKINNKERCIRDRNVQCWYRHAVYYWGKPSSGNIDVVLTEKGSLNVYTKDKKFLHGTTAGVAGTYALIMGTDSIVRIYPSDASGNPTPSTVAPLWSS
jgi:hypothetical protein